VRATTAARSATPTFRGRGRRQVTADKHLSGDSMTVFSHLLPPSCPPKDHRCDSYPAASHAKRSLPISGHFLPPGRPECACPIPPLWKMPVLFRPSHSGPGRRTRLSRGAGRWHAQESGCFAWTVGRTMPLDGASAKSPGDEHVTDRRPLTPKRLSCPVGLWRGLGDGRCLSQFGRRMLELSKTTDFCLLPDVILPSSACVVSAFNHNAA
jgi:hypothetical protein